MQCPHCGTRISEQARACADCSARLSLDVVRDDRSWLERFQDAPAAPKAVAAVIPCALAAWEMLSALDRNADAPLMISAAGAAALGGLLSLSVLARPKAVFERAWPRALAAMDAALAAAVVLAPVAWMLGQMAMIPRRMASEPQALNNARQLATAFQTYLSDYDDKYPGWVTVGGKAYHNAWDQQLASYMKSDALYRSGVDGRGIRSPSQPPPRRRVLTYALNGLVITRPKAAFDGNADWAGGPYSVALNGLGAPGGTILFAEVATMRPMGGPYARVETPPGNTGPGRSRAWRNALAQWIDIDPRAWVETRGPVNSYLRNRWDGQRGVGRDLHAGGAVYGFMDGHVEYHKLRTTVTGGQPGMPAQRYWDPANTENMWVPR